MKHCLSEEEELLIKKAVDKMRLSEKRYSLTCTGFLNETEQALLMEYFSDNDGLTMAFEGGYPDADRKVLLFFPVYTEFSPDEVISAVRCSYYKEYKLSHRDFLGAVLALGLERSAVGDIIVNDGEKYTDIVVKKEVLPFVAENLVKAGRAALKTEEISLGELRRIDDDRVITRETVASLRTDAVISAALGISREKSAEAVRSGKVFVNRKNVTETDKILDDGSLVNVVGYGKFILHVTDSVSRKGRTVIEIEKWGNSG